jgi:HEAT repeat protein
MDAGDPSSSGTVGALLDAMDLLDQLPPAGPTLRERGYSTRSDLLEGLADPDATVRRGCLELLEHPRRDDAAPRVIERLDDGAWEVRYAAVHALARDADPPGEDVVPAAIATVRTDASRYVRMLAVELVADVAPHRADGVEALERVRVDDADPGVRRKAARYTPGGVNAPPT